MKKKLLIGAIALVYALGMIAGGVAAEGVLSLDAALAQTHPGRGLSVSVYAGGKETLSAGDTVNLKAKLTGYEGLTVSGVWQSLVGTIWTDVAAGPNFSLALDASNASLLWRYVARISGYADPAVVTSGSVEDISGEIVAAPNGLTAAIVEETPAPVAEEPVVEEPAVEEPAVEEPVVEEPAVEEPAVVEPVVEEPAAEEPAVEEPAAEVPVVEEPAVVEPIVEEPAVEEPIVEEPAVVEPAVEEPAVVEPAVEEPAVEEPAEVVPAADEAILGVPLYEILDEQYPGRKIIIYGYWGEKDYVEVEDEVLLTAELVGYEGLDYSLRWQYSLDGQGTWSDLQNAEGSTYTFTVNESNYEWYWRVAVDIAGVAQ